MSGLILTTAGAAAIEAAYQAGTVVKITLAAFGDGGGKPITPNPGAMALVNKFGDAPFTGGASKEGMISGQTVISAKKHPGKILREVGLISADGVLVAYGDYPDTVLPADGAPVMKEIIINFVMTLTHAESVVIDVDPNVSALTITEADKRYVKKTGDVMSGKLHVKNNIDADGDVSIGGSLGAKTLSIAKTAQIGTLTVDDGLTVNGKGFFVKNGLGDIDGNNERQTNGLRIAGAGDLFVDIYQRERIGQNHFMGVHVANGGADGWFEFRNDGRFIANGQISAGGDRGGMLHIDGNIQGNIWGGYLSEYISAVAASPIPWPMVSAPAGWLICNGAAFDRNAFPRLASAYPSGNLPDLRGVFIRGWDAGRGLDPNRGLGDLQTGQAPASAVGRGDWGWHAGRDTGITAMIGTDADGHPPVKQETEQQRETRPVNVSFNYIVRAS